MLKPGGIQTYSNKEAEDEVRKFFSKRVPFDIVPKHFDAKPEDIFIKIDDNAFQFYLNLANLIKKGIP
jgi:hypothetical protein